MERYGRHHFGFFLHFIGTQLIYNTTLILGAQQSKSVKHIHRSIPCQILFPNKLLHNIEKVSLCYIVDPCYLSTLYIVVGRHPLDQVIKLSTTLPGQTDIIYLHMRCKKRTEHHLCNFLPKKKKSILILISSKQSEKYRMQSFYNQPEIFKTCQCHKKPRERKYFQYLGDTTTTFNK